MPLLTLEHFLDTNRDAIIGRCRAKEAARRSSQHTADDGDGGIPLFIQQLIDELRRGPQTEQISQGAVEHGRELRRRGFTIGQVVHGYGDVCQSVTDLALEVAAPITTGDFRTLNRCLDDAIAGAVTEYAREQDAAVDGESLQLRNLVLTALAAFEALQSGRVGVGGGTAQVLYRSLSQMVALIDRPPVDTTVKDGPTTIPIRP